MAKSEPKPIPMELKIWAAAFTHTCSTAQRDVHQKVTDPCQYQSSSVRQNQWLFPVPRLPSFFFLTSTESSLSHCGTMKKDIPSNAPGSCALLISRAIRITYGNRAVKYTTYKQRQTRHSLSVQSISLLVSGSVSLSLSLTLPVDFTPLKMQK